MCDSLPRIRYSMLLFAMLLFAGFSQAKALTGESKIPNSEEPAQFSWQGPDGIPLPFSSPSELEQFLAEAKVLSVEDLPVGVTKPQKLVLQKDGIRLNAIFRNLQSFKQRWKSPKGMKFNYADSCMYEVAAYRLSRLFGIPHVPPAVVRIFEKEDFEEFDVFKKLRRREGSVQAWVENAMTDKERRDKKLEAPNRRYWVLQYHMLNLFDSLIFNDDRNQTNILIDENWKLWFIDSTRAFRPHEKPKDLEKVFLCERGVYERLKSISDEEIMESLDGLLTPGLMEAVLERRRRLVSHLDTFIEDRSERSVLFDF